MIKKLLIPIFSIFILMGQMPPNIIIDENEKDIRIKPNIAGTEVVLYGAMPSGKKDIIIEVVGPARNISLEEKRSIYGFWLGLGRADYFQVPSYYNIMSSRKLSEIASQSVFDKLRLGVINLPLGNAKISNTKTSQNIFNKNYGTLFIPEMKKVSSKKQWLDTTENQGSIVIDDGACKALNQNNSLLFVGVTNVINSFEKGDVINCMNEINVCIAKGITNYGYVSSTRSLSY